MKQESGFAMVNGFPVFVPNSIIDGDGFYVSYNDYDTSIYGCDTTALVFGQMQKFYILNGDHRSGYAPLIDEGFDACLAFFEAHIAEIHRCSERVEVQCER
jgi:ABC-type sugar transport system substrate-binding protein